MSVKSNQALVNNAYAKFGQKPSIRSFSRYFAEMKLRRQSRAITLL